VIEEKTVTRLGSTKARRISSRIISATNVDLERACQSGRFRLDLLFRLRSAHIHLPPLRERQGDIPLLALHLLKKACAKQEKSVQGFSPEALECLKQMDFPGNVRELAQVVENAVLLAESPTIQPGNIGVRSAPTPYMPCMRSLKDARDAHVAYVLGQVNGNRNEAAKILGISTRQVQRIVAEMKRDPRWMGIISDFWGRC
jgi:DNA-binding NtrC family response regulator